MKTLTDELYKKIENLNNQVRLDFYNKGMVLPIKHRDGSIGIGMYKIKKTAGQFYAILNYNDEIIVDRINLPQTAALVANELALGKFLNQDLIQIDRDYGYALFEEELHHRAVLRSNRKGLDYFDIMMSKRMISRAKKEAYKHNIMKSFDKLKKIS
jgi:hypothetical protein